MSIDKVELMQNKLFVVGNYDEKFGNKDITKKYLRISRSFIANKAQEQGMLWKISLRKTTSP
jgi:hypothetical protein